MPATFDSFGLRFLYPDNWTLLARDPDEGDQGVTLELPDGGFFSIESVDHQIDDDQWVDRIEASIAEEYGDVERDDVSDDAARPPGSTGHPAVSREVIFRFYYLDLLILSRLIIDRLGERRLVIQMQAESREYDRSQQVFEAILVQIRR